MIEEHNRCKEDKVYFIEKYCGIKLYEWQKDFLNKKNIQVDTARQIGFSLLSNLNILHSIIFNYDKTIFKITSNKIHQDMEELYRVYHNCTYEYKPKLITKNKTELITETGNTVFNRGYSVNSIKGFSINEIYLQDFYSLSIETQEEIVQCILPCMLAMKHSNIWLWSCLSPSKLEIIQLEQHTLPFWVTSDEHYIKYKNTVANIGLENTIKEYIILASQ